MRIFLALSLLSAVSAIPSVSAGGDCATGPYESILPANVDCCELGMGDFCFAPCTVWVNDPTGLHHDECILITNDT